MSFPTSVLAISPPAEKAHHFHRSPISCCSLRESSESRADGQYSISGESPISRCSTLIHRVYSASIRVPRMRRLDRLARHLSGGELAYDQDGRYARAGRINKVLLDGLLERDDFLARHPPKSTGFEMYGDAFVAQAAKLHGAYDVDLMASLTEFSAKAIAMGLQQCAQFGPPIDEVIIAGGGVKNPALIERITALIAPLPIRTADALGIQSDAREAMAFAILADMTLRGIAARLPAVTGATAHKLLGKLSFP